MANLKIVWSNLAEQELDNIVEYWNFRNKSDSYSRKLLKKLGLTLKLLSAHPNIGRVSPQRKNVRIKVFMENFLIIYRTSSEHLYILDFWDTRKNPEHNQYL